MVQIICSEPGSIPGTNGVSLKRQVKSMFIKELNIPISAGSRSLLPSPCFHIFREDFRKLFLNSTLRWKTLWQTLLFRQLCLFDENTVNTCDQRVKMVSPVKWGRQIRVFFLTLSLNFNLFIIQWDTFTSYFILSTQGFLLTTLFTIRGKPQCRPHNVFPARQEGLKIRPVRSVLLFFSSWVILSGLQLEKYF